jgi:hypothetical protein
MSSNNLPSNRYDKYIPLFGRANDMRVRLFLHSLFKYAKDNMKNAGRTSMKIEDVRFVKYNLACFDIRKYNLEELVLNIEHKPLETVQSGTFVDNNLSNGIKNELYIHAKMEYLDNPKPYYTMQPKNDITDTNAPEWVFAISNEVNKTPPFINNEWDKPDARDLSFEKTTSSSNLENNIHSEWVKFFGEFLLRINSSSGNDSSILNIIHSLSGIKEANSIEFFMQFVVQLLFDKFDKNINDFNIWNQVNSYTYFNFNKIFYNFHLYNFLVKPNSSGNATWFYRTDSRFLSINNCLNAALGVPLFQLSQPKQNKPYDILCGNLFHFLPQYNSNFHGNSLYESKLLKEIKEKLKTNITDILGYIYLNTIYDFINDKNMENYIYEPELKEQIKKSLLETNHYKTQHDTPVMANSDDKPSISNVVSHVSKDYDQGEHFYYGAGGSIEKVNDYIILNKLKNTLLHKHIVKFFIKIKKDEKKYNVNTFNLIFIRHIKIVLDFFKDDDDIKEILSSNIFDPIIDDKISQEANAELKMADIKNSIKKFLVNFFSDNIDGIINICENIFEPNSNTPIKEEEFIQILSKAFISEFSRRNMFNSIKDNIIKALTLNQNYKDIALETELDTLLFKIVKSLFSNIYHSIYTDYIKTTTKTRETSGKRNKKILSDMKIIKVLNDLIKNDQGSLQSEFINLINEYLHKLNISNILKSLKSPYLKHFNVYEIINSVVQTDIGNQFLNILLTAKPILELRDTCLIFKIIIYQYLNTLKLNIEDNTSISINENIKMLPYFLSSNTQGDTKKTLKNLNISLIYNFIIYNLKLNITISNDISFKHLDHSMIIETCNQYETIIDKYISKNSDDSYVITYDLFHTSTPDVDRIDFTDLNIITTLSSVDKNNELITCYKKNGHIHYEQMFDTVQKSIDATIALLEIIKKSNIHINYKRNIDKFIKILSETLTNSEYYYKRIDNKQYYKHFINKIIPDIIKKIISEEQQTVFLYNFGKYYEYLLTEPEVESEIIPIVSKDPLSYFDSLLNVQTDIDKYENVYIRKDNGKLYIKTPDGDKEITKGSDEYRNLTYNSKTCYSTYNNENDKLKCHEYLTDCLLGKNLKGCKRFMTSHEFWGKTERELDEIHPLQILNTLSAFKFKIINVFNKELNLSLQYIENFEQWTSELINKTKLQPTDDDYLTPEEYNSIIGNNHLSFYLKQLVKKINSNPAILNKNYNESMVKGEYINKTLTRAEKFGVAQGTINKTYEPDAKNKSLYKTSPSNIHDIIKDINGFKRIFGTMPNLDLMTLNNPKSLKILSGGDIQNIKQNLKQNNYTSSNIIDKLYSDLINKLKSINKDINQSDNEQIKKHIQNLKDNETKLNQMILFINKYIDLYEIYGGDENSELTFQNITNYIKKHNKVLEKTNLKRTNILSIIETIAQTVINKMQSQEETQQTSNSKIQTTQEINSLFQ